MRINELTLATADPNELKKFYADLLGFAEISALGGSDGFSFQCGHTRINFVPGDREAKYHFAFNIHPDKLEDAVQWLQQNGVELVHSAEHKGFVIDFPNWWAKSVYFYDPAGNIAELIARGALGPAGNVPKFSAKSIVGVSEIGVVSDDVPAMREWISTAHGVPAFVRNKNTDEFSAMGDDHGLLLLVNTGRKWYMGNFEAKHFPLAVQGESNGREVRLILP
jgi:catechol 2,3-dioxygenase-like lactoylglutathione lyase family enzyme